jgi:farnesyl diphosphate synthase
MKDDLLDLVGREEIVGKRLRKDHGKQSLQYCFSLEEARRRLEGLVAEAERAIAPLELKTDLLFHIARFVAEREK